MAKRKAEELLQTTHEPLKIQPNSNYKDKYVHLIGQEAALEAARKTESNKSYGFGECKFHKISEDLTFFFNFRLSVFSSKCK